MKSGAQHLRACTVVLSDAEALRVKRFAALHGVRGAAKLLGISQETFFMARDQGRMMKATRERIIEALEREEGSAS